MNKILVVMQHRTGYEDYDVYLYELEVDNEMLQKLMGWHGMWFSIGTYEDVGPVGEALEFRDFFFDERLNPHFQKTAGFFSHNGPVISVGCES